MSRKRPAEDPPTAGDDPSRPNNELSLLFQELINTKLMLIAESNAINMCSSSLANLHGALEAAKKNTAEHVRALLNMQAELQAK